MRLETYLRYRRDSSSPHPSFDYGTLSASFVCALRHWKFQNVSFLNLPGEIRNYIYNLLIPDTSEHYTEVVYLDPEMSIILPAVALLFTCRQLQREVLPVYFKTINLRLCYNDVPSRNEAAEFVDKESFKTMRIYEGLNPALVDHLCSLYLYSGSIECKVNITGSGKVHVELVTFGTWITSSALTQMSIVVRNKIIHSLVNSPTGLLGFRHLGIAFNAINQMREWWKWKQQEEDLRNEKAEESPWFAHQDCGCLESYRECLVEEAEQEGVL